MSFVDSLSDSASTTYVQALTSAMPLQRLLLFGIGLLGSIAVQFQTHLSLLETVLNIPISAFTSLSNGPFVAMNLLNFAIGLTIPMIGFFCSRISMYLIFGFYDKVTAHTKRVNQSVAKHPLDSNMSIDEKIKLAEFFEKLLDQPRSQLRSLAANVEFVIGASWAFLLASHWGNALDLLIGISLFIVALFMQLHSVKFFLSEYLGHALLKAQLEWRRNPTPYQIH
jgi:hypothetical protein